MIEIFETEHYVFHFPRNSLAAQDIRSIAETQEKGYEKICGLLQISFMHKISYWLYDSPQLIGDVFCDGISCNGISRGRACHVHGRKMVGNRQQRMGREGCTGGNADLNGRSDRSQ